MLLESVAFIVIGLLAVTLNSIEIRLTMKKRHNLKPHDQLILSLACSDLLNGILSTTFGIFTLITPDSRNKFLIILACAFNFTALNLLAIGYDRFIAIKHPIKHRIRLTYRRMKIVILIMWFVVFFLVIIIPSILGLADIAPVTVLGYLEWHARDWTIWFGSTMLTYYVWIITITLKRRAKLNSQSSVVEARATKREIALIWTCVFSFGYYIVTAFPFSIYFMVMRSPSIGLACLFLTNTIVNPIVYLHRVLKENRIRGKTDASTSVHQEGGKP